MDRLIEKISNSDNWPNIEMPEYLEFLNEMADEEYQTGTFSRMLASLLMYHQIIESMCIHLLEDCYFQIQLALYPTTIELSVDSKKMLGNYIKALKDSIDFKEKEVFLNTVNEFNELRNSIVHEMRRSNVDKQIKKLKKCKGLFDKLFELYDDIQDNFRVTFHCYQKDVFIDYIDETE